MTTDAGVELAIRALRVIAEPNGGKKGSGARKLARELGVKKPEIHEYGVGFFEDQRLAALVLKALDAT